MAKRSRPLLLLALIVVAFVGANWFRHRGDVARYSWGYPQSGEPQLMDGWVGTLRTGSGLRRVVYLELHLKPLPTGRRRQRRIARRGRTHIEGRALMCDGRGVERLYQVSGQNEDKQARRVLFSLSPPDTTPELPRPDGLEINTLRGTWNRADSLVLQASLHLRRGESAISSSDDPDTGPDTPLPMKRGTEAEYRRLCAGIGGR